MSTFELVVETLDLMISVVDNIFELTILNLHQWDSFSMVMENIIELGFVLAGVGLFDIFDLTIFFYLQLVDILVQLSDLVHQAFVPSTVLSHFVAVLLQKAIFLYLDLLQGLHFLSNLLLELLLQCDDDPAAVVEQISEFVILGE